jgi:hypothetical protein
MGQDYDDAKSATFFDKRCPCASDFNVEGLEIHFGLAHTLHHSVIHPR